MILVAFVIAGFGLFAAVDPAPVDQFELPMVQVGGGIAPESVDIEPRSALAFKNIARQTYDYSCGSAALVTLLNSYLGMDISEMQAMEGMLAYGERDKIMARRGFSMLDMKRYVASLGAQAAGYRGEISDLDELEVPVIVAIDYSGFKHFVVFRDIRDGKVFLADPSSGYLVLSVEDFEQHWDQNTLFMVNTSGNEETSNKLALTDRELGVFDYDRINDGVDLALYRTQMLNRAVQSGLGVQSYKF